MAGFGDFLQAIQFGMGLVSGFTAQAQKERESNEANQLKLLQLLQKDEVSRLVPVNAEELDRPTDLLTNLFGGGKARVRGTGEPATMFGGQGFALREYPPIQIPAELLAPSAPAAPTKPAEPSAPPVRPFAPPQVPAAPPQVPGAAQAPSEIPAIPQALRTPILAAAGRASEASNVPISHLLGLIAIESSFNPRAISKDNAQGLMQLIPATQKKHKVINPFDITQNITGGAKEWAEALEKTGGDVRRAYLEVYNPNDPNKVAAADRLERAVKFFEQDPAVQAVSGRVASLGATATRTTPTPEISERVSVAEIPLDPPRTEQSYLQDYQRSVYRDMAPHILDTPKGRERLGVALRDAKKEAKNDYDRDFASARAEAKRIKSERQIHSYEVLNALDRVQDTRQLKTILDYIATHDNPDHLGDAVTMVRQAPEGERIALAARMFPRLLEANYAKDVIEYSFKSVLPSEEMKNLRENLRAKQQERRVGLVEARRLWNTGDKDAARDVLAIYEITGENVPTDMRQERLVEEQRAKLTTAADVRFEEQTPLVNTLVANPELIPAFNLNPVVKGQILPRLIEGGVTKDDLYDPVKRDKEKLELKTAQFALDEKIRKKEGRFTELEKAEHLIKLRGLLLKEPLFRQYSEATQGYVSILAGIQLNNAQGDLAIVNGIVKMLDPTGVVRPSEYMTAEQAQGVLERLGKAPAQFMQGDRLYPDARKRFLELGEALNQGRFKVMRNRLETTYKSMTEPLGVSLDTLIDAKPVTGPTTKERITLPVPQQAAPQQTAPQQTAPQQAAPVPQQTAPQQAAPAPQQVTPPTLLTPEQQKYIDEIMRPR